MKKYLNIIVATFFIFFSENGFSQTEYNKEVKAKIEVKEIENLLFITGTAENLKSEFKNISYKLSVFKKNKSNSNKSTNAQDGRVTLEPIQKVELSKTQVNYTKQDEVIVMLLIYDEANAIIGKDRIVFNEETESDAGKSVPVDGIEMVGIVANDTKTKLGNDFYDMFYAQYSKLKVHTTKIVNVQEELTFGRTTKITILVDSDIIEEFISRPDEDFLKYMAESSASKLFKYFKDQEKQSKMITQY
ncbi:CsgE family curli-type amyloid fiber assembly protein [Flavobacterium sp. LHD-80]|uniref:CsgE family curli-type amyloid fiber assembly protein n=1 Tax=Flavobacterium sp. LHD-80 TaxID=3071411 RepID=UPI0027E1F9AD|nr:CsgE family curli-type amyloid fiber assembly protein [Flavobacterium sp. LHD-80]MDQ6469251.1 CsgE family curli-type amyloid fiber assembly protein [Flavobacterium sp. LHD-80]